MRGGRILIGLLAPVLAAQALAQVQSTQQAQQGVGDFYGLGDYTYFSDTTPKPTPTPTPTSAPVAKTTVTSVPEPSAAVARTTASSARTAQPAASSNAAAAEPSAQSSSSTYTYPKGDMAGARAEAKALATPARQASGGIISSTDLPSTIPGFSSGPQPGEAYADDPDALIAAGGSAAGANEAWQLVTDPGRKVVTVPAGDLTRAQDVEKDPNSYLAGQSVGGTESSCKPLPPNGTTDYYEATCNKGAKLEETPATCTGRMDPVIVDTLRYFYYGVRDQNEGNGFARNSVMQAKVSAGICRVEAGTPHICDAQIELGAGGGNVEDYRRWCKSLSSMRTTAQLYSCSAEIPQAEIPAHQNYATGTVYLRKEGTREITLKRNEGSCPALVADTACTATGPEVCSEGPETRIIDGVSVTASCWAWSRPFTCQRITQASDCSDLENGGKCTFLRDECLDDPQVGACQVTTKVYKCPVPSPPTNDPKQYICGDDVYCIDGECEPVEREASTEFKDAVVGLHALGQANAEFDPDTLTLFSGKRQTCHKPVFGLVNCCAGKASGLITTAAGAAAIAGGPVAIAALATPFLTMFMCSNDEKLLDVQDRMGMCHKLGEYCSDKVLGICTSKKTAYCCFESKLSRILQEQGRPQINKPWGSAKKETCKGFTLDEFSRLDLSVMDFTEVYAEFVDAAKLPDEIETSRQIQERIKAYYEAKKSQ
ncbi:conjugal transfer protein TraN [Sphingomonas paucimobilis]|uniref:Conjugal transfer protein TraN n=1 Tax=Sphingomonas paucimobilis TaxID=13689 RepID=A0A7Y2KPN5_SPHPI|nr:conjugal transfer protein TraN [Sphingomonas paucimobilis]NNG56566.1 conjugal transfer protein TraN [Sphingomonas paucimobilis]